MADFSNPIIASPLFPLYSAKCFYSDTTGVILSGNYSCAPGFYCPNTTPENPASLPQYCPPSNDCVYRRLLGSYCGSPQGPYEPQVCRRGYYCPDWRTKIRCPKGYYCPTGSIAPIKCSSLSSCNEGSATQIYVGGLVFAGLADFVIIAIALYMKITERAKQSKAIKSAKASFENIQSSTDESESSKGIAALLQVFSESINNQKLRLRFDFKNLGLKQGKKVILDNVSGTIKSGRLTAIMGPSGSGKTTFMNVLMGKVEGTSGSLLINGKGMEITKLKKLIGYVPQDDIMIRELSVRENILHCTRVRMPYNWGGNKCSNYADAVVKALNLSDVQHNLIGDETTRGISGGQRKRVNIGLELAGAPLALFLDEPTSGLDSTAALNVCEILKRLTRLGITVVSVIHQPRFEIFSKFDDILLILPGGRTAYMGPVSEIQRYFKEMGFQFIDGANPADVLMDILSGDGVDMAGTPLRPNLAECWNAFVEKSLGDPKSVFSVPTSAAAAVASAPDPTPLSTTSAGQLPHMTSSPAMERKQSVFVDQIITDPLCTSSPIPTTSSGNHIPMVESPVVERKPRERRLSFSATATAHYGQSYTASVQLPLHSVVQMMEVQKEEGEDDVKIDPISASIKEASAIASEAEEEHQIRSRRGSVIVKTMRRLSKRLSTTDDVFHLSISKIMKERGSLWIQQLFWCHNRYIIQQLRQIPSLLLEVFVGTLAGLLMGISVQGADGELYSGVYLDPYSLVTSAPFTLLLPLYCLLIGFSVALAGSPAGVKVFGEERLVFWRESSAGHSGSAYYLGKTLAAIPRIVISSLHFTAIYQYLAAPTFPDFGEMYSIVFLMFYGVYGLSCIVSAFVKRENANLMAVVGALFASVLCGFGPTLNNAKEWGIMFLWEISFNKWGSEALYSYSVKHYKHIYNVPQSASEFGYTIDREKLDLAVMFILGSAFRLIGFIGLTFLNRYRQK